MTTADATTRKPKKGDTIFVVGVYSDGLDDRFWNYGKPCVYVRELRVESWGKVQGTATDVVCGEFLKHHLSPTRSEFSFDRDGTAPLVAAAVELVRRSIEGAVRIEENWLANYPHALPVHRARAARKLAEYQAMRGCDVTVADYATLRARTLEQFRAEQA